MDMGPLRKFFGLTAKPTSEAKGKEANKVDKPGIAQSSEKISEAQKVNAVGVQKVTSQKATTRPHTFTKGIAKFIAIFSFSKKPQVEKAPPEAKVVRIEAKTVVITPELRKAWIAGAFAASEAVSARMEKGKIPDGFFRTAADTELSNKYEAELKKGSSIQSILEEQNVSGSNEEAQMHQLASYLKKSLGLLTPSLQFLLLPDPNIYQMGKEGVNKEMKVLMEADPEGVKNLLDSLAKLMNKGLENEHNKKDNETKMTPDAFGTAVPSIFPLLTHKEIDGFLPNNRYGFPEDDKGNRIPQDPPALVLLNDEQLFYIRHNETLREQQQKRQAT